MWNYNGKKVVCIEDLPKNCTGFLYIIHNTTKDKYYIGKKSLYHWKVVSEKKYNESKQKGSQVKRTKSRAKGKTWNYKARLESDWLKYTGSNKDLNKDIKSGDKFTKKILVVTHCTKNLTFLELEAQIKNDVLRNPEKFYNGNILGKFFPSDVNC